MLYKDYEIDNTMIDGAFSVCFCGDEIIFDTEEEAKQFIDEITSTFCE